MGAAGDNHGNDIKAATPRLCLTNLSITSLGAAAAVVSALLWLCILMVL